MMKLTFVIMLFFIGLAGFAPVLKQSLLDSRGFSPVLQPSLSASIGRGKKVYQTYCLACHQADGTGVPRLNPPLVKTSFVLGDKKMLIGILLHGLNQEIEIDGDTYYSVMASHDFLKDQEIADVLTYVRNSFGNKASAILPAEVASLRAAKKK
jgi:mono/diheme cytochrome c family protein